MPERRSAVEWKGTLREGAGEVRLESGTGPLHYAFATRFEEQPGSNPEELLAGALGSCFTMALAGRLSRAGNPPEVLRTSASAMVEKIEGEWTVTGMTLRVGGKVAGLGQADFEGHAAGAKDGCPISRALRAVPISLVVDRLDA